MPASLAYWNIRGLAQPIRLLLAYTGEEYEDVQYEVGSAPEFNRDSWLNIKETFGLDFSNLPYYIDGDVKLTQSNAILCYIADKHNLAGKDAKERATVLMLAEQVMDLRNGFVRLGYNPNFESMKADYLKNLPNSLALFEKFLKGKKFLMGDQVTYPDFHLYEMLDQHKHLDANCLNSFPNLVKFINHFEAIPSIKQYMESNKFMKWPLNNKMASFGAAK